MLDNLAVSTSHPQSRGTNNNVEMSQFYVHFSGPGSSCSLWTGPTPPPSSQSCATMFSATGYRISNVFPANLFLLLFLNSQKKAWSAIVSCPGMQRAVSMATARSGRSIGNTGSIKWRHGLGTLLLFLLCRKKGILDEVRHYAADIIAMQEVEIVTQIIVLTRF